MTDSFWPYNVAPLSFVPQVPPPQATQPVMPQMTPAFHGPAHQALYDHLHSALQQQNAVPGLLAQMQADPAMAQRIGGLLGGAPNSGIIDQGNTNATQMPTPWNYETWKAAQPQPAAPPAPVAQYAPYSGSPGLDYNTMTSGGDGGGSGGAE